MPHSPESTELTLPKEEPDPELEALPEPRRPGRRPTLVALAMTALGAASMVFALRTEATYSLKGGPPKDLGDLTHWAPDGTQENQWVRAEGPLGTEGAIRYARPLDGDSFRLAPVAGNDKIWVEVRVPAGLEGPHFVPPGSFVGRLIPMSRAGLRHSGLSDEITRITSQTMAPGAWLLVDGESPSGARWALGLVSLFVGFVGFSLFGLYRLLRPIRDA